MRYIIFPAVVGVLLPNCIKSRVDGIDTNIFYLMWRFPSRYLTFPIIFACGLALAVGFVLRVIQEFLISRRERAIGLVDLERDAAFEKKLHKTFMIIFYVLMLTLYIANFVVFTLDF